MNPEAHCIDSLPVPDSPGTSSSTTSGDSTDTAPMSNQSMAPLNSNHSLPSEAPDKSMQSTEATTGKAAQSSGIKYCSEYQYYDGEFAYMLEGEDELNLSSSYSRRRGALPLIIITSVCTSRTTKDESKKKNKTTTKKKTVGFPARDHGQVEQQAEEKKQSTTSGEYDLLPEDIANSRLSHTYMMIHPDQLLNVLRHVVSYYPSFPLFNEEYDINEPYQILYHHREELRAYKHPDRHDEAYRLECNRQLGILWGFLDKRYGNAIRNEEERWARKKPVCTFNYLWLLFKPGEVCYLKDEDGINAYITQSIQWGGPYRKRLFPYTIEIWNVDYNGYVVGGCSDTVKIAPFDGERVIDSLEYYPTRFHDETQENGLTTMTTISKQN